MGHRRHCSLFILASVSVHGLQHSSLRQSGDPDDVEFVSLDDADGWYQQEEVSTPLSASGIDATPSPAPRIQWALGSSSAAGPTTPGPPPSTLAAAISTVQLENMTWLHIPKCGTSFVNTLVTWGCPDLAETDWVSPEDVDGPTNGPALWFERHSGVCDDRIDISSGHEAIPADESRAGMVTMMRQPEQRIISGFYHHKWGLRFENPVAKANISARRYGEFAAGCTTRMMTGRSCMGDVQGGEPEQVSWQQVEIAIKRLKNEFAFVGLTEYWDLSVCLFHKMFGGGCHHREFMNIRVGRHADGTGKYDPRLLEGFTDIYDGPVYAEAQLIFWSNIHRYGVTDETCKATCKTNAVMSMALAGFSPKGQTLQVS